MAASGRTRPYRVEGGKVRKIGAEETVNAQTATTVFHRRSGYQLLCMVGIRIAAAISS